MGFVVQAIIVSKGPHRNVFLLIKQVQKENKRSLCGLSCWFGKVNIGVGIRDLSIPMLNRLSWILQVCVLNIERSVKKS